MNEFSKKKNRKRISATMPYSNYSFPRSFSSIHFADKCERYINSTPTHAKSSGFNYSLSFACFSPSSLRVEKKNVNITHVHMVCVFDKLHIQI